MLRILPTRATSFFDYLETMLLVEKADRYLTSGRKPLMSTFYRTLSSRVGEYENAAGYSGSDFANYLDDALNSIERLYPQEPLQKVAGGNAVFARDGVLIATIGRAIVLYDITQEGDSQELKKLDSTHPDRIVDLAVSKDLKRMVTIGSGSVRVWNISNRGELANLDHNISIEQAIGIHTEIPPAGESAKLTAASLFVPGHLRNRPAEDGARDWVMVANSRGQVGLWDQDGKWKALLRDDGSAESVLSVTSSADGRQVYTSSADGLVRVYELGDEPSGIIKPSRTQFQHEQGVHDSAISNDGRVVTTGPDKFVKVWDAEGHEIAILAAPDEKDIHRGIVDDVELSSDGRFFATVGRGNIVNLWSTEDMSRYTTFLGAPGSRGVKRLQIHPNFDSEQNQKILVSRNSTRSPFTYVWNLSQFDEFDASKVDVEELGFLEKRKLGLVASRKDAEHLSTIAELIEVTKYFVSKRARTPVINSSYIDRLEGDVEHFLGMLKAREQDASWDDKWTLMRYIAEFKGRKWIPENLASLETDYYPCMSSFGV